MNLRGSSNPFSGLRKAVATHRFWSRRFKPSAYPRWNIANQRSRPTTGGGHPIAMIVAQKLKTSVLRVVSELSRLLDYSAVACLASCFPFRHKKITQSITSMHQGLSGPFPGLRARSKLEQPRPSLSPSSMPEPYCRRHLSS